jgi:hypothetical protein
MIGDAVPPRFAQRLGDHLRSELACATPDRQTGALLSFVVTHASGVSPALKRTCEVVTERFLTSSLFPESSVA